MDAATEKVRCPWNKGKLVGQKLPLKPKEIWAVRFRLQLEHRTRDLALLNLGIDSKLRGCDLVTLRVRDVVQGGRVCARAIVMQQKAQRPVKFEITEQTRDTVGAWVAEAGLRSERPNLEIVDGGSWSRRAQLRHACDATDQGDVDLPSDPKPSSGAVAAGAYQDREHRALPRCRG